MKLFSIVFILIAASTIVDAKAKLLPFAGPVVVDKSLEVGWTQTETETLENLVVQLIDLFWKSAVTIFTPTLWGSKEAELKFTWQVDASLRPGEVYAFFLRGQDYGDISAWFEVKEKQDQSPLYYEELELVNGTKWARFQLC